MSKEFKSKKEVQEYFKYMLQNNTAWAIRGLMAIAARQNENEIETGETLESNGVGFNKFDSVILTSFYQALQKYGSLSEKQSSLLKRKIGKYAGQLLSLSLERGTVKKTDRGYEI